MSKQFYFVETYRPQLSVGYLIKRAHSLILDLTEPLFEQHGFTFVQYIILSWVRDGLAVNPAEICIQFRHDSGAMTRVIDQLAERGLLERVRRDRDRRKVELQLTRSGRETVEKMIPLVVEKMNQALGDFSEAEFHEFIRLLMKLNGSVQCLLQTTRPPAVLGS